MHPDLIYCAGGNRRFAQIAIEAGFKYGAQLPRDKPHFPIHFADQDWKKPDRSKYMAQLAAHRPSIATVLDLQRRTQLRQVIDWAEEASQYCSHVVIIPKVRGAIQKLPRRVNNKDIILGFSVPSKYGATTLEPTEFSSWPVHLLGGSPHRQISLWRDMSAYCDIVSIDGNYTQLVAIKFNKFWANGDAHYANNRWLPRLDEADQRKWAHGAPYEAFRRSCRNIMLAWSALDTRTIEEDAHG